MSTPALDAPFALDFESFCRWLADLPRHDRERRYTQLFAGLGALNEANVALDFHFKALEEVSVAVFQAAANLSTVILGKSFPLPTGLSRLGKLAIQFHAELASGYARIAQQVDFEKDFDQAAQGRVIHAAFRSFTQKFLLKVLLYEPLPTSFWLRLNALYLRAEQGGLCDWSEICPELACVGPVSVQALYLRILTFRLAMPHRLEQAEIQQTFDLIQQHGALIELNGQPFEEGRKADFSVDLASPMPSSMARLQAGEGKDLRYVYLSAFRRLLDDLGRPPRNKDSVLATSPSNILQVRLGMGLVPLPDKKSRYSIVVYGYSSLLVAMPQVATKLDSEDVLGDYMLLSLDEHVLPTTRIESSKTQGTFLVTGSMVKPSAEVSMGPSRMKNATTCSVSPADRPGFYIIESPAVALPPGKLVGLFTDNKLIQFGLVCPGCNELIPYRYGFELLAAEVSLVRVVLDSHPKKSYPCFFSDLGNGRFGLITPPLHVHSGDGLIAQSHGFVGVPQRYRIAKQRMKAAEFCQFELVLEKIEPVA